MPTLHLWFHISKGRPRTVYFISHTNTCSDSVGGCFWSIFWEKLCLLEVLTIVSYASCLGKSWQPFTEFALCFSRKLSTKYLLTVAMILLILLSSSLIWALYSSHCSPRSQFKLYFFVSVLVVSWFPVQQKHGQRSISFVNYQAFLWLSSESEQLSIWAIQSSHWHICYELFKDIYLYKDEYCKLICTEYQFV